MLSKLAFNPSTYHTSSKTGYPGMSTVPMPLITNLLPSPKVTVPIFPSKRVLNKPSFPVICLEQSLSKYQRQESLAIKAIKAV